MFAVVKTGGKQYKVQAGDVIRVEKLDAKAGDNITLSEVTMIGGDKSPKVGAPLVKDASVNTKVLEQDRNDKVVIFKKKRRHTYRRTKGHRQPVTVLYVTDVTLGGKSLAQDELRETLTERHKTQKDAVIIIQADADAPHGSVVELMDIAREVGFSQLAIATEAER